MDIFFIISILASILMTVIIYIYLRKKHRIKNLIHNSASHGFVFQGDIDLKPVDKFAPLRLFSLQGQGTMKNVLKRNNPSIWVFDYEYNIPHDQNVGQTVVIIEMYKTKYPPIVIETRKKERFTVAFMRVLTQKLTNWQQNYHEINTSKHPEFAKSYCFFCQNNLKKPEELLPDTLFDFMIQNPGWNIEIIDQWLLIYHPGKYLKGKEFDSFLKSVLNIYKLIEEVE